MLVSKMNVIGAIQMIGGPVSARSLCLSLTKTEDDTTKACEILEELAEQGLVKKTPVDGQETVYQWIDKPKSYIQFYPADLNNVKEFAKRVKETKVEPVFLAESGCFQFWEPEDKFQEVLEWIKEGLHLEKFDGIVTSEENPS